MAILEEVATRGISFALSDEQRALRELAREFGEKESRPKAAEYDEHATHPADVIVKAHEVGLMNVHLPEEYGGAGLPGFAGMLIGEELSWGCSGIAVSIVANTLGSAPVFIAGTDEQKREWLPPLAEAPMLCSFGLSEPEAGSDVARIKTKADPTKGHRGLSAFVVPMDAAGVTVEKHLDKMGQRATDTSAFSLQDVVVP